MPDYTPITKETYIRNYADEIAERVNRERYKENIKRRERENDKKAII